MLFSVLVGLVSCGVAEPHPPAVVLLDTEFGPIEIPVNAVKTPLSAASFCSFVDAGLYEGAAFYRTVSPENDTGSPPISVIQGGVLEADASIPPVAPETTAETGIKHRDRVVSRARADQGSGSGAALFICIGNQPAFDYGGTRNADGRGCAAFGKVMYGLNVVAAGSRSHDTAAPEISRLEATPTTQPHLRFRGWKPLPRHSRT